MLRNIQREQQVHQSARLAEVEARPPAQEVKWSYGKEITRDQKDQMHTLVSDYSHHYAFGMHDLGKHTTHQMRLDLIDNKPIFWPRHRLSRV